MRTLKYYHNIVTRLITKDKLLFAIDICGMPQNSQVSHFWKQSVDF